MSDHSDVPDLEVNLPATPDGLRVTTDFPYRLLLVSNLAGCGEAALSGPLKERVVEVNAESFDELFQTARPSADFTIADPVSPGGGMVGLSLVFTSLRDFDPKRLVEQIPSARALLAIRSQIAARMRGQASAAELADAVAHGAREDESCSWLADMIQPRSAQAPVDPQEVNSLLDQLDLGDGSDSSSAPPESPIASAVSAAAGSANQIPAEEASALRRSLVEIDRRAGAWLTAALHAPAVQQIESAWRGLAWLVKGIEFRKGIRLSVLHADGDAATDRFNELVIDPVFDEGVPGPALIVVDSDLGNTATDMATLDEFAQHAASLPAVVFAGISPTFFGAKHNWQIATLPPMANMFDQWQFAKWKTIRSRPYARNLGAIFGRLLLRAPFGREKAADLEFVYKEPCLGNTDLVWGSGALAGAFCVARCFAAEGWPARMSGKLGGRIEDLPQVEGGKKGDKMFGPADTNTPQDRIEEMGMCGINAVAGQASEPDATFWNGQTAARVERAEPNAWLEISLPYQLVASRLSTLLWELRPSLERRAEEQVLASVRAHVGDWLGLGADASPEQLVVQVQPDERDATKFMLAVTITPQEQLLPGGIPIVIGYSISR